MFPWPVISSSINSLKWTSTPTRRTRYARPPLSCFQAKTWLMDRTRQASSEVQNLPFTFMSGCWSQTQPKALALLWLVRWRNIVHISIRIHCQHGSGTSMTDRDRVQRASFSLPASFAFIRTCQAIELFRSTDHSLLSNQVTSISHPIHRFVFYLFQEHAKVRIDLLVNQANWPPPIISFSSSLELFWIYLLIVK
jgi:hypothetical protein